MVTWCPARVRAQAEAQPTTPAPITMTWAMSAAVLKDGREFDLDRNTPRQGSDTNGRPGMATLVVEELHQQMRSPIDYRAMAGELRRRCDEAAKAHEARDPVQTARHRIKLCEGIQ